MESGEHLIDRLVIGVPTVQRPFNYVQSTVRSLIDGLEPADRERTRIIVVNADTSHTGHPVLQRILQDHAREARAGLLSVVDAPAYPSGPGEDESPNWHRKQTWDAAACFELGAREGSHYLHIEDDIIAAPGYLPAMEAWLRICKDEGWTGVPWFVRTGKPLPPNPYPAEHFFGTYGFLLTATEAGDVATYLRAHLGEFPADILVARWLQANGRGLHIREPSLFQHVGAISSEPGQFEWLESRRFAGAMPRPGVESLREAWAAARLSPPNGLRVLVRRLLPPRGRQLLHLLARPLWRILAWRERRKRRSP